MDELQRSNASPQAHVHITHVGWMYMALVFISFAAVIGTGAGVYYLQQGQVDALSVSLNAEHEKKTANVKNVTPATATFDEQQVPYTFSYPADWSKQYSAPIHINPGLPQATYAVTLTAPGTVVHTEPIGSQAIKQGAQITVDVGTVKQTSVEAWIQSFPAHIKFNDRKDVTVAGVRAVEFLQAYESQDKIYTVFIKDGTLYKFSFVAGDGLRASKHFQQYKNVLATIKFK